MRQLLDNLVLHNDAIGEAVRLETGPLFPRALCQVSLALLPDSMSTYKARLCRLFLLVRHVAFS